MRRKISLYFMNVIVLILYSVGSSFLLSIYRYYYNVIVRDIELHAETNTRCFFKYNSFNYNYFIFLGLYPITIKLMIS